MFTSSPYQLKSWWYVNVSSVSTVFVLCYPTNTMTSSGSSFVTVWCCLADCSANICCQSANNLQWDSFHPCEWRVWLNLHFFCLILSTSKVFFKNVLSSFMQYIHSCVSTGSAPRFIVISDPPSLTLCTLLLSGLAPCLLFCLGMGGWARGRGWAAHEKGRKKRLLLPFPLVTTTSTFPQKIQNWGFNQLSTCGDAAASLSFIDRNLQTWQNETELNFTKVMTAIIHRQSGFSRAWMTRLE